MASGVLAPHSPLRMPGTIVPGLVVAWLGLAGGTWPGLALCLVLPVTAMLIRIRVEEEALVRVLGDPYRTYQSRTKRLLPGLW